MQLKFPENLYDALFDYCICLFVVSVALAFIAVVVVISSDCCGIFLGVISYYMGPERGSWICLKSSPDLPFEFQE